ncbi:MAG: hypothetical protein A2770_03025 [Candidatus Levybacteria bacterium RIFCSPHIGHO2_01_FULL_38_12]|nr:MAG: hypothetical protein A2770_03025 [Candidatus Levybacteria bacterium RIFCSPHIGHO2_01_FULL_38_12]
MQALRDNARFIDHGGQKMYGTQEEQARAMLYAAKYAIKEQLPQEGFTPACQEAINALLDGKTEDEAKELALKYIAGHKGVV